MPAMMPAAELIDYDAPPASRGYLFSQLGRPNNSQAADSDSRSPRYIADRVVPISSACPLPSRFDPIRRLRKFTLNAYHPTSPGRNPSLPLKLATSTRTPTAHTTTTFRTILWAPATTTSRARGGGVIGIRCTNGRTRRRCLARRFVQFLRVRRRARLQGAGRSGRQRQFRVLQRRQLGLAGAQLTGNRLSTWRRDRAQRFVGRLGPGQ